MSKKRSTDPETTADVAPARRVVVQHRYMCEKCGGFGEFLSCRCGDCFGVGYLGFRKVTKDYFYSVVGAVDCEPRPTGRYPYTSQFTTPQGTVVGAYIKVDDSYWVQDSV